MHLSWECASFLFFASFLLVGVFFLVSYMACDSFTSNWQDKVFKQHRVGPFTMMMYANLFSSAFTAAGLLVTLEIVDVYAFILANPSIVPHMVIMACCSAFGQLFIFSTIKAYGPLVFTTIMTIRQLLSIFNSIVQFGHPVSGMEMVGIGIVFAALAGQIVYKYSRKRAAKGADVRIARRERARGSVAAAPPRRRTR